MDLLSYTYELVHYRGSRPKYGAFASFPSKLGATPISISEISVEIYLVRIIPTWLSEDIALVPWAAVTIDAVTML